MVCLTASDAPTADSHEYKALRGTRRAAEDAVSKNYVRQQGLTPSLEDVIRLPLERDKPWSLPRKALAAEFDTTLHILVLRFNFQYEETDDPNTTGRGVMDFSTDTLAFFDSAGHMIDPPPHDSSYFDAHMRALRYYWETVSEGKLSISWDIWPPGEDTAYTLPMPMNHYGRCDSVVIGLENYYRDCIATADETSPEIHFADYQSIFLFHAGSDRQNDIGFPETCSDLFSGFIRFGDSVWVDTNTYYVRTGLILPETSSQDNRATALNAVIAHEFGHQLGLVDLYDTRYFLTQLGDFALMDNNGFGTGIEFAGFTVGRVFGAIPLYPCAWSRAYLGLVEVHDFRQGTDIRIAAAEVASEGIKVARVPITEKEYYLIENRLVDTDGLETVTWADKQTSVIMGPGRYGPQFSEDLLTGEYDFLMPGSGMLIYHVDESVIGLDYDGDGQDNFNDNDLQWDWDRRFVRLIEADGIVNFGGGYYKGYGEPEDMFRDDRKTAFTPNTNPPAIDNTGNNTRVYITGISRLVDNTGPKPLLVDSVMRFDVETDKLATGFPKRAGHPVYGLNPVVDDLDRDGHDEIIVASGDKLSVVTTAGESFLLQYTGCTTCPVYEDSAIATVNPGQTHPLALYVRTPGTITASPVTGDFGDNGANKFIATGYQVAANGWVRLYELADDDADGLADEIVLGTVLPFTMPGVPLGLSFGNVLWAVDSRATVVRIDTLSFDAKTIFNLNQPEVHGICRLDDAVIVMAGDSMETRLYYIDSDTVSFAMGDYYNFGPVLVDVNRDNIPEVAAFSSDGKGIYVSVDLTLAVPPGNAPVFSILADRHMDFHFTVNPAAGDIDGDGYPEVIIGGTNRLYAFNRELILKTDFPIEVNDGVRFQDDDVIWPPVVADIERGGRAEIVFPTNLGNVYSFGDEETYGFPISGGEKGAGSPVIFADTTGGKLGYLGADGWFYAWDVNADSVTNYWPMGGHDAAGTYAFDAAMLPPPPEYTRLLPEEAFYNYPNPVVDGFTTIRYFLGKEAVSVSLSVYDLSGQEVATLDGPAGGQVDNERVWQCGGITPGVYRCVINVDFGGSTETAFTDIAIIR